MGLMRGWESGYVFRSIPTIPELKVVRGDEQHLEDDVHWLLRRSGKLAERVDAHLREGPERFRR